MTYTTIKKQKVKLGTTSFTCRAIKNLVVSDLEELLQLMDWNEFYNTTDPNRCWEIMYLNFLESVDTLCPGKTFNEVKKRSEWVTSQLFELMIKRDHLFKEAKNYDKWSEARQFRNTVNEACKYAKGDFIKQTLDREQGNPRTFWEKLKPLYDTKSVEKNVSVELDGCTSNEQVMDTFNSFFLTVGENLKKKSYPLVFQSHSP